MDSWYHKFTGKEGGVIVTEKQRKIMTAVCIMVFLLLLGGLCIIVGRPLIRFVSEPEKFRAWVDVHGLFGRCAFIGMMMLQVFVAFIPGEPLEIGAGYAFGAVEGTILCLLGILIGSAIVFLFVKKYGTKAVSVFYSTQKILSFRWIQNTKRLKTVLFVAFVIPGTPKDILTYMAGLTKLTLPQFLTISMIARIPSIVTSTIGGNALGMGNYLYAVIVFAATLAVSGAGVIIYKTIKSKVG